MREAADMIRLTTDYEPYRRVDALHAWARDIFRRGMEAERLRHRHITDQAAAGFAAEARALVDAHAQAFVERLTEAAQRQAEYDSLPWYEKTSLGA